MGKTLKRKNQPHLVTFTIVNVLILSAFAIGTQRLLVLADGVTKGNWTAIGKVVAVPAVVTLLLGLIGWAIPREWKETIIFWRLGNKCLPSSRAFSQIADSDPRINFGRLSGLYGPFPLEPAKQTSTWYAIYRRHLSEPSVEDAHGAYLLYREMVCLVGVSIMGTLIASVYFRLFWKSTLICVGFLVIEYIAVMLAARFSAEHLVANVLAIASAPDAEARE